MEADYSNKASTEENEDNKACIYKCYRMSQSNVKTTFKGKFLENIQLHFRFRQTCMQKKPDNDTWENLTFPCQPSTLHRSRRQLGS